MLWEFFTFFPSLHLVFIYFKIFFCCFIHPMPYTTCRWKPLKGEFFFLSLNIPFFPLSIALTLLLFHSLFYTSTRKERQKKSKHMRRVYDVYVIISQTHSHTHSYTQIYSSKSIINYSKERNIDSEI